VTAPTISAGARDGRPEVVTRGLRPRRQAWIERATSADHKVVAQLYLATALTFIVLAAVEFTLMRVQLTIPQNSLLSPEIFNRLMTASGVSFVVLGLIPLCLGLIGYLVPLQIGARGVALPRLNQFSYWLYLAGSVTIYGSFLYAVPELGNTGLPPLSDAVFTPTNGNDAWVVGTALVTLGFVCFAVNLIVTLRKLRAPGLAWRRLPIFSWAATVVGYMLLIVGPAMISALVMLEIDRRFDGIFFDPGEGGAPLLYQHFSYIFFTGAHLIVVITAAGAISEILPTFSRKPLFSHLAAVASLVAVAVLGVLAWMQNMYSAPLNEGWTIMAMAFALALAVPVGLLIYNWIATIWGGTLELRAPTWYALVAISTMLSGLVVELVLSVIPVGWMLDNTTASQGATLYVLVGGGVIGGFAALHYWFPKLSGRLLGEGAGRLALALMFLGINLYVVPMLFAGLEGQPADVFEFFESGDLDTLNVIASVGAFVLVAGILVELGNAAHSWNHGLPARGHDPWRGTTLEWFAPSPPPPHNFDAVPDVRSGEPLLDIRESIRRRTESLAHRAPARAGDSEPRPDQGAERGDRESVERAGSGEDRGQGPSVA
jgi:cytochrome c oxidase subunit I